MAILWVIHQVGFGISRGLLQGKVVPGWCNDRIYCLVRGLLYCPSVVVVQTAVLGSTKGDIPDTEKVDSPSVVFLWECEIVMQFRRTENASCQPIVEEVARETGQVKDIDANAQDGHQSTRDRFRVHVVDSTWPSKHLWSIFQLLLIDSMALRRPQAPLWSRLARESL